MWIIYLLMQFLPACLAYRSGIKETWVRVVSPWGKSSLLSKDPNCSFKTEWMGQVISGSRLD